MPRARGTGGARRVGVASDAESQTFRLGETMAAELVQFMTGRGGQAKSQEIVDHFGRSDVGCKIVTPREQELFKQLLKQLATQDRRSKMWILKEGGTDL